MSPFGPKRHFAAPNNRVAIGVTTDIDRHPVLNASVVNDRAAKLAAIPAGESPANRGVQSLL